MVGHRNGIRRVGRGLVAALGVATLALGACTTTGVGGGEVLRAGERQAPVQFAWTSKDGGVSGTLTASLENEAFEGRFFQITQQTERTSLAPLWIGFRPGWYDWPYGGFGGFGGYDGGIGPYDDTQFVTHYTGRVVANLGAANGDRMRCRLQLVQPAQGMSGGGAGECQLTGGRTVEARF